MSTSTREQFRQAVADVAARARLILPASINGRLEGAVALVLQDDVWPQADGSIQVGSCTDATKVYRLVGTSCECKDFTDGKAPQGWCRHRIAAGLHRRVGELLAAQVVAAPVPQALPEAPASVNVRLLLGGRDCQLTLRDTDETRLLARLQTVLKQYPLPQAETPVHSQGTQDLSPRQHNAAAMHRKVTDFCQIHNVQMTLNTKDGRSWYSHRKPEGGFCKGR
jgi:hypothetical protein